MSKKFTNKIHYFRFILSYHVVNERVYIRACMSDQLQNIKISTLVMLINNMIFYVQYRNKIFLNQMRHVYHLFFRSSFRAIPSNNVVKILRFQIGHQLSGRGICLHYTQNLEGGGVRKLNLFVHTENAASKIISHVA